MNTTTKISAEETLKEINSSSNPFVTASEIASRYAVDVSRDDEDGSEVYTYEDGSRLVCDYLGDWHEVA